jgi:hypothetical protein
MPRTKKTCFFITPIGKPDSGQRKRADQVQRHILTEVLSPKFKIVRADGLPHAGSMTHQIISLLYQADLVVADLTGSNANVAYELAVRHAFNKVSIHLIDKADAIPFDLKDERTIVFSLNDADSIASCRDELKSFVDVILKGKVQYSSPVFRTLGIEAATAEEREAFLEKMSEQIDSIAIDVDSMQNSIIISDIENIDTIKDEIVESIKEQHLATTTRFDRTEKLLREILVKLTQPT